MVGWPLSTVSLEMWKCSTLTHECGFTSTSGSCTPPWFRGLDVDALSLQELGTGEKRTYAHGGNGTRSLLLKNDRV